MLKFNCYNVCSRTLSIYMYFVIVRGKLSYMGEDIKGKKKKRIYWINKGKKELVRYYSALSEINILLREWERKLERVGRKEREI